MRGRVDIGKTRLSVWRFPRYAVDDIHDRNGCGKLQLQYFKCQTVLRNDEIIACVPKVDSGSFLLFPSRELYFRPLRAIRIRIFAHFPLSVHIIELEFGDLSQGKAYWREGDL